MWIAEGLIRTLMIVGTNLSVRSEELLHHSMSVSQPNLAITVHRPFNWFRARHKNDPVLLKVEVLVRFTVH